MPLKRICDQCEGTGRLSVEPYSSTTFACPDGCNNGWFDLEPADFVGERVRYRHVVGTAFIWAGRLCLEDDDLLIVVDLKPSDLEILNG